MHGLALAGDADTLHGLTQLAAPCSAENTSLTNSLLDTLFARCAGAYSDNTLRGYRNDLEQFQAWCSMRGFEWLPAQPSAIASFVDEEAGSKAIATIKRRVEAIRFAHRVLDLPPPAISSEVHLAMRRASRTIRRRPNQAHGLTRELLELLVAACPASPAGLRDAALMSVGYDTLCRSAELAAILVEHLAADYATIFLPCSKSDPFGDGRVAHLSPPTRQRLHLRLEAARLSAGPLFRGNHTSKVSARPLDTSSIRRLVKRAAQRAGLAPEIVKRLSGHSMRVGAAQDMMLAGIDTVGIMQAGGWKTHHVLARYVSNVSAGRMHDQRWARLSELAAP